MPFPVIQTNRLIEVGPMKSIPSDIAFTPAVKAIQEQKGSRAAYARVEQGTGWATTVTPDLKAFLAEMDMFYLGTSSSDGQPYIQYRGGPKGFLKPINETTLGFADFGGNQQFISAGNLSENPRSFIFLMDYVNRRRIKIWGRARVVENDEKLIASLAETQYKAKVERAILFEIEAWDVNCPQHIHRRLPAAVVEEQIESLHRRIKELESELAERTTYNHHQSSERSAENV